MLIDIILILLGLVLLVKGGDWLVDGSVSIAHRARLSAMVIGITVMGFGTSAPELFVSLQAAIAHSPGLCIGNVVGSNIVNIGLILGVTALICPCITAPFTLKVDVPVMILSCVLLTIAGMTGTIGRLAGLTGIILLVAFTTWEIRRSRRLNKDNPPQPDRMKEMALWKAIGLVVLALALLVTGANVLVRGASDIARIIGEAAGADPTDIERIIGLTIVAVGTSLPELFASVMAARKGEQDLAVGNIVGSVTFNILFGIGLPALICPIIGSDTGFLPHYIVMTGLAMLLWLFMRTRLTLERWEGGVLMLIYAGYVVFTVVG